MNDVSRLEDPIWLDFPESLPDGSIILGRDIKEARNGRPFRYFPVGSEDAVSVPGCRDYMYYLHVWRRCDKWGLPFPGQWIDQPSWVLDLIEELDAAQNKTEMWLQKG